MFTNSLNTYKALQPFESIEQLNKNTEVIREQYREVMQRSTKIVLDVIHRYASKYYGVCYLSKEKIATLSGLSRRTVIRACQQLESLGCVKQYETKRISGDKRQSSNAIVFVTQINAKSAFCMHDTPNVTADVTPNTLYTNAPKDEKELINTNDTARAEIVNDSANKQIIKDGLVTKLPNTLQKALAPFFDTDELYVLAGVVFKAKASIDRNIALEDYESEYYEAIISVMNAYKRGAIKTSVERLLYASIKNTTYVISRKIAWNGIF